LELILHKPQLTKFTVFRNHLQIGKIEDKIMRYLLLATLLSFAMMIAVHKPWETPLNVTSFVINKVISVVTTPFSSQLPTLADSRAYGK